MENASKALIIAGGVLVSVMVLSVLIFFFHNIRDWQKIQLTEEEVQQATEFNKQYDVYARNLYGSDILTIANKIVDYNKRESDNKGYSKIEMSVKFGNDGLSDLYFVGKKEYSAEMLYDETASKQTTNGKKSLEEYVKELGDIRITSSTNRSVFRQIKKLYTMRTQEIKDLGINITDPTYQKNMNNYTKYKNLLSDMKQRTFKYIKFDYDKNTGRITKMYYELM